MAGQGKSQSKPFPKVRLATWIGSLSSPPDAPATTALIIKDGARALSNDGIGRSLINLHIPHIPPEVFG